MAAKTKTKPEKSSHPLRDNIEVVVFAIVMALGLKVFAIEAYQIPTGSMMPTLMGTELWDAQTKQRNGSIHDRVLVDKLSFMLRDPERWEVVVFRYPLVTHNNYVKRLIGMPGEWIDIREGNVYAHGPDEQEFKILRKPKKLQDTLWKQVFPVSTDTRLWRSWSGSGNFVESAEDYGTLRGRATVEFGRSIRDDYLDGYPDSIRKRVPVTGMGLRGGSNILGDLKVETWMEASADSAPMQVRLDCGPYVVAASVPAAGGGKVVLDLPDGEQREEEIAAYSGPLQLTLAFWDHRVHLGVRAGDAEIDWIHDAELEGEPLNRNRIAFATTAGDWRLGLPNVWRDIHYLPTVQENRPPFEVPEGEYFMMGDNTQNSLDSRDFTARIIEIETEEDGVVRLRGDQMSGGHDPDNDILTNPRWNREHTYMTFRDQFGELFVVKGDDITYDTSEHSPTVPRRYIIGKAIFVFLPIPPFSPVARIRAVL